MENIERREARAMTRREVITKAIARQLSWVGDGFEDGLSLDRVLDALRIAPGDLAGEVKTRYGL
jgi:hypothetical protein